GLPIVVKPNDSGSSVGISIVKDPGELKKAVTDAFAYGSAALLESYIDGRELTVTILDGKALPVVEIKPKNGFYDYNNKYQKGNTEYIAPAVLDDHETLLVQLFAERAYKACGCSSYARVDFRYDGKKFYFLEVNTLPGMTPLSLSPMAAKAAGMSFGQFLQGIIKSSLPQ
ncbi:MAG: ATP-grasp domain-containing protein, partial [Candidatus Cloacimonadaceae bacterium]|nr:ATP-grasp domain-containing protein [Candidatus Cloacimonadaceae bacterium]